MEASLGLGQCSPRGLSFPAQEFASILRYGHFAFAAPSDMLDTVSFSSPHVSVELSHFRATPVPPT